MCDSCFVSCAADKYLHKNINRLVRSKNYNLRGNKKEILWTEKAFEWNL